MSLIKREYLNEVLKEIISRFEGKKELNQTDLEYFFDQITYILSAGSPSIHIKKYLLEKSIIRSLLLYAIIGSRGDQLDDQTVKEVSKLLKTNESEYFYRFRVLSTMGYYPSESILRNNLIYTTSHLKPVLLTKNRYSSENRYNNGSEITIITRMELKFSTALICASKGLDHVYFNSFESLELDAKAVELIPENLKIEVFMQLMSYKQQFQGETHYGGEVRDRGTMGHIFKSLGPALKDFYAAFDAFRITDQLLMRTSVHLMKAIMLWDNRTFAEDAIAHTLFSLEGVLHLLYSKWGGNGKINMKFLESKFEQELDPTGELFYHIKDGYKKRIMYVHPETAWGSDWNPFLQADDFYEYFKISRLLLLYHLTGVKQQFPY